jgi:hypothetical protein
LEKSKEQKLADNRKIAKTSKRKNLLALHLTIFGKIIETTIENIKSNAQDLFIAPRFFNSFPAAKLQ